MSFPARYEGTCAACGDRIHLGERIVRATSTLGGDPGQNTYVHEVCPDDEALSLRPGEEVCSECFLVKPCGCDS